MTAFASVTSVLRRLVEHPRPRFTSMNDAWTEFLQWALKRHAVDTGKRPDDLARAQRFIDAEKDGGNRDDPGMQAEAKWFATFDEQPTLVSAARKWLAEVAA